MYVIVNSLCNTHWASKIVTLPSHNMQNVDTILLQHEINLDNILHYEIFMHTSANREQFHE